MGFLFWRPKLSYTCACCGKVYKGSPSFAYKKPSYYFDVPEEERDERVTISDDLCHIRGKDGEADIYAIRGTLDIPIMGVKEPLCWGVWVTQSRQSFEKYVETFKTDQSGEGSFGWLTVTMPYFDRSEPNEELENLACDVKWGKKGQRPKIVVQACDHPLYHSQADGIDWDTAVSIAQAFLKVTHQ